MVSASDRQALAAKNGKPRDANRIAGRTAAMDARDNGGRGTATDGSQIERVGDTVYRYVPKYDHTIIERGGASRTAKGNQLPGGSIDGMIDQVLEMSGMTGGNNIPIPTARPDMSGTTVTENTDGNLDDGTAGGPDDVQVADETEPEGGWSTLDLLLGALGIGGATAAARALMARYNQGERGTINPDGSTSLTRVSPDGEPDDITAIADTDEQRQVADQKTKRLPAPNQQIEGPRNALPNTDANLPSAPSPIDETIASTLSDDEFDQRFIADTKQITDADSPYTTRPGNFAPSNAPQVNDELVEQARALIDSGDIRGAFRVLNEAGIDIDPRMMEVFAAQSNTAKSLRKRAMSMSGQAAVDAARRTAR